IPGRLWDRLLQWPFVWEDARMTVGPDGPVSPGPDPVGADRAAALLRHAQNVADELQTRAEEESTALRTEAEQLHARAERDRQLARKLLDDTSADAQQIVGDAGEQARVLMETAQSHHDEIVAEAEQRAAERLTAAQQAHDEAVAEAERIRDEAQQQAEAL